MTNAVDDILGSLDIDQLAAMVGGDPADVAQAAAAALPALFGGLDANAQDPMGASSILDALGQHDASLLDGGVDLDAIDTQDGAAITQHIFGDNTEAVYSQLGGYSAAGGLGGSLIRRLLPILAPIVLSYVMKQMTQRTGGGTSAGRSGGGLDDILGQVLGGGREPQDSPVDADALPQRREAPRPNERSSESAGQPDLDSILKDVLGGAASGQSQRTQTQSAGGGSILTDILGGLLGGGRR